MIRETYQKLRVFVSSPSEVRQERDVLEDVISRLNRVVKRMRIELELLRWEKNAVPDIGETPQDVISRQIAEYDIFIGIMWKRFGTPTGKAGSGTAEEFDNAYKSWSKTSRPRIVFYFCERAVPFPETVDEVDQLKKVIEFRERLKKLGLLYATYRGINEFMWLVHDHLFQITTEFVKGSILELPTSVINGHLSDPVYSHNVANLKTKLDRLHWVAYAPVQFDPDRDTYPTENSLREDCRALAAGPFDGIITFGSEKSLGLIPRIAQESGLAGIIMGIYNLRSHDELRAAVACKDIVDGYCVGHRGLGALYDMDELLQTINKIRKETKRPVSTTETMSDYMAYPQLVEAVDWLFPDMHYYWHEGARPEDVINDLLGKMRSLRDWFKGLGDRKVVLKMISYPSSGGPGLSEKNQAHFLRLLLRRIRDDTSVGTYGVKCTFFAAFDNTWKLPERGWSPAELSTGFYSIERQPKPALEYFMNLWKIGPKVDDS